MARSTGRQRYQWALLLLAAVLLVAWLVVDGAGQSDSDPTGADATSASPSSSLDDTSTTTPSSQSGGGSATDPESGLPIIGVAQLPREAERVLSLIVQGGPFDEDEDGSTFENREDLLPEQPRGYYREYTVPTPGSADRGARRIVGGDGGELYWTADHYRSFSRIAD